MTGRAWLIGALLAMTASLPASAQSIAPRVQLEQGQLAGVEQDGVWSFRGIPYAGAPVGPDRWRAPGPAPHWTGVRAAARFAAQCMQRREFDDMRFRADGMSEDCLYLNVWRPRASSAEPMPVLVYFYGGGFVAGDGSEPRYDGASLAAHGIVTVTVNYRLGIFGFFAHPALSAESAHHVSGWYGLQDQIAALEWVRHNIAQFGGDPARITIGGESAGSMSVSALMASPLSRGLIAGAIGESGSALFGHWKSLAAAESEGRALMRALGARSLAELRAIPAAKLLERAARVHAPWQQFVDGYVFPRSPAAIYAAGEQAHVPLLAGSNNPELPAQSLFESTSGHPLPALTLRNVQDRVRALYGSRAEAVLAAYGAVDDRTAKQAAAALASDRFIAQETWKWVDEVSRVGPASTYYYRFDRGRPASRDGRMPPDEGAVHSGEIEYALGNLPGNPVYAWTAADQRVSDTLSAYFVNFIRHGDPNGAGLPTWPTYASGQLMVIDDPSHAALDTARARHRYLDRLAVSH